MARRIQYRGMPTLSDPFLKEAEQLFETILTGENGDVPHADFLVDYALDICEFRQIVLEIKEDNTDAILKSIDLKEGVAEKLGISDKMLEGVNRMIAAKDLGGLTAFYERLIKIKTKKGERGEK